MSRTRMLSMVAFVFAGTAIAAGCGSGSDSGGATASGGSVEAARSLVEDTRTALLDGDVVTACNNATPEFQHAMVIASSTSETQKKLPCEQAIPDEMQAPGRFIEQLGEADVTGIELDDGGDAATVSFDTTFQLSEGEDPVEWTLDLAYVAGQWEIDEVCRPAEGDSSGLCFKQAIESEG